MPHRYVKLVIEIEADEYDDSDIEGNICMLLSDHFEFGCSVTCSVTCEEDDIVKSEDDPETESEYESDTETESGTETESEPETESGLRN
jgi:hypothetical protein